MPPPDELVVALARAYGMSEILDDDDQRFREAVESARELLPDSGDTALEVRDGGIRSESEPVEDDHGFVGEMARDLDAAGVGRVELSSDLSLEGLLSFLRALRDGAGSGRPEASGAALADASRAVRVHFDDGGAVEPEGEDMGIGSLFGEEEEEAPPPEPAGDASPEPVEDAPTEPALADEEEEVPAPAAAAEEPSAPETSVPDLVEEFIAGEPGEREALSRRLEEAAGELQQHGRLDDVADAVGALAAHAHEGTGDPEALSLARSLLSPGVAARLAVRLGEVREEDERQRMIRVAADMGEPMAEAINEALADTSDRSARRTFIEALVEMGDAGVQQAEKMIDDGRWFVVRNGVNILGEVGGERAVEHLTSALGHDDARVRREAVMALARIGGEDAGDLLVGMVDDPDGDVRAAVAMALGVLKVERAVKPLLQRLEEESEEDVQVQIIRALGALGDPGAVSAIEKKAVASFFSRPPRSVRIAAYKALSDIGTPHAREVVEDATEDRDLEVREAVQGLVRSREE